jgi:hypothetical protein
MKPQDIRVSINDFLDLLENSKGDAQANMHALELALDRLALAYHFAGNVFVEYQPDPPKQDYERFRKLASVRFPRFGLYNVPSRITDQIMETELQVGDALDDLADIARDLSAVVWCWEHTSEMNALWHFRFGYEQHWGEHLRHLQSYLSALRSEH